MKNDTPHQVTREAASNGDGLATDARTAVEPAIRLPAPIPGAAFAAFLPPGLTMAEQAAGVLRSFLEVNNLSHWQCHFSRVLQLVDIDEYLERVNDPALVWTGASAFTVNGLQVSECDALGDKDYRADFPGFLWLKRFHVVLYRWHNPKGDSPGSALQVLCACPTPECLKRFVEDIEALNRKAASDVWQFIGSGFDRRVDPTRKSDVGWDDLVLPVAVRQRLQTEVIDFFSEPVVSLYRDLKIPHRRGVLLHGPPGNGKTSIIRVIGGLQTGVAAILVRAGKDFDDDDFARVIHRWVEQAPALLVIEDLDWLLPKMSLSTFLNQIDGIEHKGGGLLMIATTNHPGELDPAVNNRPGRFDVVIEVPSPSEAHRLDYFRRSTLQNMGLAFLKELASGTDGLSFAHLREIESLSGLIAVRTGRRVREVEDVREAMRIVTTTHAQARRGFPERRRPAGFSADDIDV